MHRRAGSSCQSVLIASSRRIEPSGNISLRQQSSSAPLRRPPGPHRARLDPEDYAGAKKVTTRLIDRTVRILDGWKHTKSPRGVEKRLAATIKNPLAKNRGPSVEQIAYNTGEGIFETGEETSSSEGNLPPGTFVETRRNEISSHGIVLGEAHIQGGWRIVTLTSAGEVWFPRRDDILFSIPSLTPVDLATRCGILPLPTNPIQVNARVEVLRRLRQIEKAAEDAYNSVSQLNSNVYDLVRSPDPEKWVGTTVAEVSRLVTPSSNLVKVFAIHKFLMAHSTYFVAHSSYRRTQSFNVRPQSHVAELETIKVWSRLSNGPIQSFAKRARKIMKDNEGHYKESYHEAPSQKQGSHSWSQDDKTILSFLLRSLRPYRSTQTDPYSIGQSAILKSIDPEATVDDERVQKILVDLGVLAPWQDLTMLSYELNLDLGDERTSARVKMRNDLVTRGLSSPPKQGPLGPEDFHRSDPLESVRHDFGDTPVFVIDEGNAQELDDGISLERIPSEPDSFWVHVHIADPASVIPQTHLFAKTAAIQGESLYLLQRTWPLFPRTLMHSPEYGLSLGSRKGETRVLTFSAKVDAGGNAVDFKVRAGIIRNINIITYDEVDLAVNSSLPPVSYPFGGKPNDPSPSPLAEAHSKDLRDFMLIAQRLITKRITNGGFFLSKPNAEVNGLSQINPTITSPTFEPSVFRGFPKLRYKVQHLHDQDSGAHSMVSEMMKLGCRAVSRFCLERGTPMLRRVSAPVVTTSESALQVIMDNRRSDGYVSLPGFLNYISHFPSAEYSLEPKEHFGLGVMDGEGYVRSTSPLRRYGDLVAHWQLHHALLGNSNPPPFDAERLQDLALSLTAFENSRKSVNNNHNLYWKIMFIKRWMEDTTNGVGRQNDPLDRLEAYILDSPRLNVSTRGFHARVDIPILGIPGLLEDLDHSDIPSGTSFPVKISALRLGVRPLVQVVRK